MTALIWLVPVFTLAIGLAIGRLLGRAGSAPTKLTEAIGPSSASDTQARWLALYALASGNRDRARFILEQRINSNSRPHPDDWIMLLDILHTNGDRDSFDALAKRYGETSGVTPPEFNEWRQIHPECSGLNRRHAKLLEIFSGLGNRDEQRKLMTGLACESTKPGRPGFTLAEAEELLKLRIRLNPKPAAQLALTQPHTLSTAAVISDGTGAAKSPAVSAAAETATGNIVAPRSKLGRTGSHPVQVEATPSRPENPRCALERQFQRIADKIAETWPNAECARYIDSLLVDTRGGRQGFPAEVMSELFLLHALMEAHNPAQRDPWDVSAR